MTSKVKLTDLVNNARRLVCDTGYVLVLNHGFTGKSTIVRLMIAYGCNFRLKSHRGPCMPGRLYRHPHRPVL